MAVLSSSSSSEEWYVGINGVPVGPVRLSELRRKAAANLITEDSLVWREGFEEWLPLRTFPELVAMLKESAGTTRASLTPAPPGAGPHPSNRPIPPPAGLRAGTMGIGPRPAAAPRTAGTRSNVVALASRRATAEKIDGLGDLAFDDDISVDPEMPPLAADTGPLFPPGPTAAPSPADSRGHSGLGTRLAESRRAHPAAWLVVGLGGMFLGVAAMVFLLPKANSKPAVQIVSVMVPTPQAPPSAGEGEGITLIGPIEVSGAAVKPTAGAKGTKATDPAAASAPAPPLSTGLSGLSGLVGGPAGPSGGTAKSGGGQQLAAADVERVVQSHRAFVKRQCWESALASRPPSAPSSARVVVTMNVAPDGRVQSVNASGGDGYPGLSGCVQGQVKSWAFPPSEGSTVTVPFVFAAQ
jgi:outer membrane biosynthesis protein TonB